MAILAAFFGCSAKTPETPLTPAPGKSATAVTNDSIPFPVYMNYSEFEPHLNRSNDTTYVVNFWATWCKPCVEEMPLFEKLITATASKPIKVLLVSMDFPKDIQQTRIQREPASQSDAESGERARADSKSRPAGIETDALARIADFLARCRKPVIYAGGGVIASGTGGPKIRLNQRGHGCVLMEVLLRILFLPMAAPAEAKITNKTHPHP